MSEPKIDLAYASPVLRHDHEDVHDLNARLRSLILERASGAGGVGKSNVGGWHSDTDFFNWPHPEANELLSRVAQAVKAMMAAMTGMREIRGELDAWGWANVLYDGGYNQPHVHPESMWSGVYYVDAGQPKPDTPNNGLIEFQDPRTAVDQVKIPGAPFTGRIRYQPRAGSLLLFPGWLSHFVNPYRGDTPRISVAFNVRIVNCNVPEGVSGGALRFDLSGTG